MTPKEILKEAFDSDLEVLNKAFESDEELAEYVNNQITSILVLLVKKDIISLEELEEVRKIIFNERNNKDEH